MGCPGMARPGAGGRRVKVTEAILHARHAKKHVGAALAILKHRQNKAALQHLLEADVDLEWIERCLRADGTPR
jgi:hypothetical protein